MESGIICRYKIEGITVDVMPTDDDSIGFKNIWYAPGFKKAVDYTIDDTVTVKILPAPYFIATKLEAFKNRGEGDGRTSHDFEDIIYVLENRDDIWDEMTHTDDDLKQYLRIVFGNLIMEPNIFEWIDAHVERGSPPSSNYILDELKAFCLHELPA